MSEGKTFWGHVEVFRWLIIRSVVVVFGIAVAAFCFKDIVFEKIIFAPCDTDFVTYRLMQRLGLISGVAQIDLININLASQLMTHLKISFYIALVLAFPYLIVEIWLFVKPALYASERKPAVTAILAFFFQFFLGMALAYWLIFPLTFNFLGTYQVSARVANQISLNSYISTFLGLVFVMGLVFEMPIVAYFFARIGVLRSAFLKRWRKVAVVVVMVAAAFITPSTDIFTMCLVALPLWLLYEFSIVVTRKVEPTEYYDEAVSDSEDDDEPDLAE
ncbi:MAG: twin-arginine translocase subunit TatC [Bacteroidales bacterium]|nr:twin-arginine translocase subunit TatC [Bacteroidales bacterium]